jgi:hypothetical protein
LGSARFRRPFPQTVQDALFQEHLDQPQNPAV